MAILKSEVVPKNSGAAFEVTKGQRLRTAERKIFDFVAINLTNFNERLDQAVTRGVNGATYSSQSRILVSNRRRIQFNPSVAV